MRNRIMLLLSLVVLLVSTAAYSQQQPQQLPVDENIRMGTLPNGMKYYLYKNDKPKGLINYHIVHNVGAIQEEDHQNGLAHFLEHMAFNGTTNLPGKMLLDYLQSVGVEFGRDINAMTGTEMTTYMIKNVPNKREGIIDTAIMAIADWSGGVALEHKEIDAERGVILEEKRTIDGPRRRMQMQFMKHVFKGTLFTERDVIGPESVLKNFKYQDIKDFYHKWYRPDLQAVIIAGDMDIDAMEAKVKKIMGAIPAHKNPTPKEVIVVKQTPEDYAVVVTDKENTSTSASVITVIPAYDEKLNSTDFSIIKGLTTGIVRSVMAERFGDIAKQPNAPFMSASFARQGISEYNDIIAFSVSTKNGELAKGLEAATKEVKRLYEFGVTDDEVARVIANYETSIKKEYDNRAERKTEAIARILESNFLNNSPMLSPEMKYQIYSAILPQINAAAINQMLREFFPQGKNIIFASTPETPEFKPTEESLMAAYNAGLNATVEAPKVVTIDRPLIANEPEPVKIRKESKDKLGNTVWRLKNGAKVVVKPTDFMADQIMFVGSRKGGSNMLSDEVVFSMDFVTYMLQMSGLGTFSASELPKVLAGKSASVGKSIDKYSHSVRGGTVKADIETMFKLLYLSYTAQQLEQKEFDILMGMVKSSLQNIESTPDYQFQVKYLETLYGKHPRIKPVNNETIGSVKLDYIKEIHDTFFDGVGGMTFVFTGSVDEATLKPLVEKYIATLPKGGKKHQKATSVKLKEGVISEKVAIKQESPKTTYTAKFYTDDIKDISIRRQVTAQLLQAVLDVKYTKSIREEMGATYGVGSQVSTTRFPKPQYAINVKFDTEESKLVTAAPQVKKEIVDIANGSDISSELEIARGAMKKNYEKSIASSNQLWMSWVLSHHLYGNNSFTEYPAAVDTVSAADIAELAKEILASGNHIEFIMVPAE